MKNFKFLVGALALFALVVANVWNAATVAKATALNIEDMEALAQYEPNGGTTGMDWEYCGGDQSPFKKESSTVGYKTAEVYYYVRDYVCTPRTWGTAHCRKGDHGEGLSVWNYLWENGILVMTSRYSYDPDGARW